MRLEPLTPHADSFGKRVKLLDRIRRQVTRAALEAPMLRVRPDAKLVNVDHRTCTRS